MSEPRKDVIRPTDREAIRLARTLMRTARHASLGVLEPETGAPFVSRVAMATDVDGTPVILVSSLSAHTGALLADPRASLLVGEPGKGDPLAHPRMSVACLASRIEVGTRDHERLAGRFLSNHPKSRLYAGFADFSYFSLAPQQASLNGGFGKAYALSRNDLVLAGPAVEALRASERGAVSHMNEDHRDAISLYARHFAGRPAGNWIITGLDTEGMDLAWGAETCRIPFPEPVAGVDSLRRTLVSMAGEARASEAQAATTSGGGC